MERRRVRALLARAGGVRVAFADMVRWVVASLCLVAALFWCWMFGADSASPEVQPATAVDNASPNAARAEVGSRDQADDASSGARTEVGTKPEPDFVSVDENGELIGTVSAGLRGAAIGFAVPISFSKDLIRKSGFGKVLEGK